MPHVDVLTAALFLSALLAVCVQNATACMMTPECYQPTLSNHLLLLKDEAAVQALLEQQPHSLDAVVIFPHAAAAAATRVSHAADAVQLQAAEQLSQEEGSGNSHLVGSSSNGRGSTKQKQLVGCGAPGPPDGDGLLLDYVIRMNSSDVPPTQLLQDLFDVSPGVMPLPGNLLWWVELLSGVAVW